MGHSQGYQNTHNRSLKIRGDIGKKETEEISEDIMAENVSNLEKTLIYTSNKLSESK